MLKACGLRVNNLGEKLRRTGRLYTLPISCSLLVILCTIIVHRINTGFTYLYAVFTQGTALLKLPCFLGFYTLSTVPINTTNLIKD